MKRIFKLFAILLFVFIITGCTTKPPQNEDEDEVILTQSLSVYDKAHGYYTALYFEDGSGFIMMNPKYLIDDAGFQHGTYSNTEMGIEFEAYHREGPVGSLDSLKKKYADSEGYKEYTWNKYPGFVYNANENHLSFALIVDGYDTEAETKKERPKYTDNGDLIPYPEDPVIEKEVLLIGKVTCLEDTKCNVKSMFNRKEFQTLFRNFKHRYYSENITPPEEE